MSPNVGNFVHDLVEMAKAMETLPQVEAENARLNRDLNIALDTVQDRELAIARYKAEIDELNAKVRSLEVERDDASFRVLEAEDKAHVALSMARSIASAVGNVIVTLDPPKPQPEPVVEQPSIPEAVHSIEPQPQGQGEADPIEYSSTGSGDGSTHGESSSSAPQSPTSQDQSEVNPTAYTTENQSQSVGSAIENASSPIGPYANKLYSAYPTYVSYHDWLAGGGTDYSYHH